jgi:ribosome-binding protein aMBF1 (putative translation factor)
MNYETMLRSTAALAIAVAALSVAGCVNPSAKIATSLERYGFQPAQSQCVGDRLEANLSIGQLQQLGRAARASKEGDTSPGRLTVGDFIRVAGQVKDPKVPLEVGKAAAGCGILTDQATPL